MTKSAAKYREGPSGRARRVKRVEATLPDGAHGTLFRVTKKKDRPGGETRDEEVSLEFEDSDFIIHRQGQLGDWTLAVENQARLAAMWLASCLPDVYEDIEGSSGDRDGVLRAIEYLTNLADRVDKQRLK
jgi:hypothetical protein